MNGYLQDVCRYLHVSEEKCYGCFYGGEQIFAHVMGACFSRNGSVFQS